jgi:hypothetical protein
MKVNFPNYYMNNINIPKKMAIAVNMLIHYYNKLNASMKINYRRMAI